MALVAAVALPACTSDDSSGNADSSSTTDAATTDQTTTTDATTTTTEASSSTTDPGTGVTTDPGSTGTPTQCPTHVQTERIASLVDISYGWTGQGHGADPVDGMVVSYELLDCDDECRRCRIQGPVPNIEGTPNDPRRCHMIWQASSTSSQSLSSTH